MAQISKWKKRKCYLQFLMSEMKTANPRIPSPFDTAGMFAGFCLHSGLIRKNDLTLVSLSNWTGAEDGQLDVW